CVSIVPDGVDVQIDAELDQAKTLLGTSYLKKKDTVEVEGRFDGDSFRAKRIEIEEPDKEIEVKSELVLVDLTAKRLRVGSVNIVVNEESTFFKTDGQSIEFSELPALLNRFCKADAIPRDGILTLRKLVFRDRVDGELDELQGQIEALHSSGRRFQIGETEVKFGNQTPVYWDVDGVRPPSPQDRGLRPRSDPRLKRILRVDDDDLRAGDGIRLADGITLGGEFQWDLEWRRNHNLRNGRPRDRLVHEPSVKLEFSFDVSPHFFAFTKLSARRDIPIFDERDDDQHGSRIRVSEAYFLALDFPIDGLALEVGRQKFDHGREWVMDDEIDGVRLFLNTPDVLFEFSVSQKLFDESKEEDGITNILLAAHLQPFEQSELFVYALHRSGGRLIDLNRLHLGFSYQQQIESFTYWADFGYVIGEEGELDVEGFGFDVMFMYVFEDSDWQPSLYAGLAWGSGDDDISDGKDSSFRQTGINDNNDDFNGVTSFRYLGELVRPEVSNLMILTFGFGLKPYSKTSVDVIFHYYEQVKTSSRLRDTRIRLDPGGLHDAVGTEVDLVIGLQAWRPVEIEIVLGYFRPGQAFEAFQDAAWFATFQVEWNF
ncbi:MAG: alginate production protein, partial [Planctomycetota bacterium]